MTYFSPKHLAKNNYLIQKSLIKGDGGPEEATRLVETKW